MNQENTGRHLEIFLENDAATWGVSGTLAYVMEMRSKAADLLAVRNQEGIVTSYEDPEIFRQKNANTEEWEIIAEYLRVEKEIVDTREESVGWAEDIWLDSELLLADVSEIAIRSPQASTMVGVFDFKAGLCVLRGTKHHDALMEVSDLQNSYVEGYQNLMQLAAAENLTRTMTAQKPIQSGKPTENSQGEEKPG